MKKIYSFSIALLLSASLIAQEANQVFKAAGTPVNPKVQASWNRYYDHAGITALCKKIAAAYSCRQSRHHAAKRSSVFGALENALANAR